MKKRRGDSKRKEVWEGLGLRLSKNTGCNNWISPLPMESKQTESKLCGRRPRRPLAAQKLDVMRLTSSICPANFLLQKGWVWADELLPEELKRLIP